MRLFVLLEVLILFTALCWDDLHYPREEREREDTDTKIPDGEAEIT